MDETVSGEINMEPNNLLHIEGATRTNTSYTGVACPICGTSGAHHCLGYRPATGLAPIPVDWNRLINLFDRLVTLVEKRFGSE